MELNARDQQKIHFLGVITIAVIASLPTFTNYAIAGENLGVWLERIGACLPGLSAALVYNAYVLAVNLATAAVSYASFRGMLGKPSLGLAGCLTYTLSPYRIFATYDLNAVDRYTATLAVPVLLWGLWRLFGKKRAVSDGASGFAVLAFGFADSLVDVSLLWRMEPEGVGMTALLGGAALALLWGLKRGEQLGRRCFWGLLCGGTLMLALYQLDLILITGTEFVWE